MPKRADRVINQEIPVEASAEDGAEHGSEANY